MANSRKKQILLTSGIGIAVNLFLGALKVVFAILSGSLALLSDAVNNITDSSSSLITIVGTKLASRDATPNHPFGFGRVEYLSSMIIGIIVSMTGIETFISSIKNILAPTEVKYSVVTMIIIVATMAAKIVLGVYTENTGRKLDSDALVASGKDAKNDALISLVTLISAVIYLVFNISVDEWASAVISFFIIKTGIEILKDTLSKILGEKADDELAAGILKLIKESNIEGIGSPHDLVINNYGPDMRMGSVNVELDAGKTVEEVYPLIRKLQMRIYEEFKTMLVIGFYAVNSKDQVTISVARNLSDLIRDNKYIDGFHGIFVDKDNMHIMFDITIQFGCDRKALCEQIVEGLRKKFPYYEISANIDSVFARGEYSV